MKKELYIIDEKLKNDQMSLKKIVHCDIVSTVEQGAEIGERIQVITRLLLVALFFLKIISEYNRINI